MYLLNILGILEGAQAGRRPQGAPLYEILTTCYLLNILGILEEAQAGRRPQGAPLYEILTKNYCFVNLSIIAREASPWSGQWPRFSLYRCSVNVLNVSMCI